MYTASRIAGMIDHTLLKPYAAKEDFTQLCKEARDNGFAMVAINSAPVNLCKKLLADCPVHVGAAISFLLGQTTLAVKYFDTEDALKNGADEIDYVVNLTRVKAGDFDYIEQEMRAIVGICRQYNAICKVIFENCFLTKEEILVLCAVAKKVEPDFVKTSTGFGSGGATVEDVWLMKSAVGDKVKVKAAGGIRTLESCLAMIEAGAERIGTSSGLAILRQLAEQKENT